MVHYLVGKLIGEVFWTSDVSKIFLYSAELIFVFTGTRCSTPTVFEEKQPHTIIPGLPFCVSWMQSSLYSSPDLRRQRCGLSDRRQNLDSSDQMILVQSVFRWSLAQTNLAALCLGLRAGTFRQRRLRMPTSFKRREIVWRLTKFPLAGTKSLDICAIDDFRFLSACCSNALVSLLFIFRGLPEPFLRATLPLACLRRKTCCTPLLETSTSDFLKILTISRCDLPDSLSPTMRPFSSSVNCL